MNLWRKNKEQNQHKLSWQPAMKSRQSEAKRSCKHRVKNFATILLAGTLMAAPSLGLAAPKIQYGTFTVEGKQVKLSLADIRMDSVKLTAGKGEVPPLIINSRTLVSVRMVSEKLDAQVAWDGKKQEVTVTKADKKIVLTIGKPTAKVNGLEKHLPDKVAPLIVDDRTMLPIRFLADEFFLKINYDRATNSIDLTTDHTPVFERPLTEEEKKNIVGNVDTTGTAVTGPEAPVFGEEPNPPQVTTPVVPTTPKKPVVIAPNNTSSGSQKNIDYELIQSSFDNEKFLIKGVGQLSYQNFYVSDPERLVFDIQGVRINPSLAENKLYSSSSFLTQMNSYYYSDENRLRMTLNLASDVSRKEITIQKSAEDIVVEYKSAKPLNSNLKLQIDRITANVELKMTGNYSISDLNWNPSSNTLEFTLPDSLGNLKDEVRNLSNNLVNTVRVTKEGNLNRVTLSLKDRVSYNMTENGLSGKAVIRLKKEKRVTPMIVIDAGHGAKDPGAIAKSTGMTEKELNLIISRKLYDRLIGEGYQILMTRDQDTYPELKDRAILANSNEADIFISIHHNAGGNSSANGIETLYYPTEDNKKLAEILHREIVKASGATDRRIIKRPDLVVLNSTDVPAVLLELGYMTNAAELQKISDDAYQNILVEGIINGIKAYLASN